MSVCMYVCMYVSTYVCKCSQQCTWVLLCTRRVKSTRYMRVACRRWLVHRSTCWKRLGRTDGDETGRWGTGEGKASPVGKDSSELRGTSSNKKFQTHLKTLEVFFFNRNILLQWAWHVFSILWILMDQWVWSWSRRPV